MKISLANIRANQVALRAVDQNGEGFLELVASVKTHGVLNAISVREKVDPTTNEKFFEIVDGLHRYTAARAAGLAEIEATVTSLSDDQVLEAQIVANIQRIETRPVEYAKQIRRILIRNPMMTEAELAGKLAKSTTWIRERLDLNKISDDNIAALVDEGKISLSNAYMLAKLPEVEQAQYVQKAMTMPPAEFLPLCNARIKELKAAAQAGKDAAPAVFEPQAIMRKAGELVPASDDINLVNKIVNGASAKTAVDGAIAALKWVLHLDPEGKAEQIAKEQARAAQRETAKAEREAQREAAKAERDAAKAAAAAEAADKAYLKLIK
jgi:ParB family chromosome partitioning protein